MSIIKIVQKILLGVVIITLANCTNKTTIPLLPPQNFLVLETAIDNNIENARYKAISLLSQHIFVSVKNNFYSIEKLENNNFNSITTNEITLDTTGYFKDLTFSPPQEINKNKYKISVGLTNQALINTITYLINNLNFNLIDSLNQKDLRNEYNKTTFLLALTLYAQNNNIQIKNFDYTKVNTYKNNLSLRLSDASQLKFNVLPNLTNIAKINIINKDYNASESIFLPNGIYYYTVYAKGYKPLTQKIEITSKDKLFINVYLQALLNKPVNIKLDLVFNNNKLAQSIHPSQVASLLEKYQLQVNNFSNNSINITFLPAIINELNGYYYFNLPLTISLIKNTTVKLTQNFNITYVSKNKNSYISPKIVLEKLDDFLEELTMGDILLKAFVK